MSNEAPSYEQTHDLLAKYVKALNEHWLHNDVFSFNWWLMLVVTILVYVVWLKNLRKQRLTEILLYGALITVISLILDLIGVNMLWWGYPVHMIPVEPSFLVLDLSQMPIAFSAVYQRYGEHTKPFFIAVTALAALYSFVVEPLLSWLGIYRLHNWEYWYSFPLYILLAFAVRSAVRFIKRVEKQAQV